MNLVKFEGIWHRWLLYFAAVAARENGSAVHLSVYAG